MEDTVILKTAPGRPGAARLADAVAVLKEGGVIGFPTDTVYGLGADAGNKDAVRLLYSVKRREEGKPTGVLVCSREQLDAIAEGTGDAAEKLMKAFWPGPLTLVLKAAGAMADSPLTAGTGTVAVRMPGSALCLLLIKEAGCPLTAPSANMPGRAPARSAREVLEAFKGKIPLIIDGGPSESGSVSTMVDLSGGRIKILREGKIGRNEIRGVLGTAL